MITARAWSTTSSAYRWADRRAASCRAVMRSAAGRAAGVRDLTARGQELPVVVERMEREPQDAPGAGLLDLAVRGAPAERPELPASGPDDDLPDSPRPLLGAGRVLGSEPFVVVVVAVDHEVGMGSVEEVPERGHLEVVAMLTRAEPRVMPEGHRAARLARLEVRGEPAPLRRGRVATADVRTVGVEDDDMPRPEVHRVPRDAVRSSPRAEVPEIAAGARR